MSDRILHIHTIPAHRPFADSLARGLLAETADDPLMLADYRILLPTRRACRAMRDAFLRIGQGRALLLPRMEPIGDMDTEAEAAADFAPLAGIGPGPGPEHAEARRDLPPAIDAMRRHFLLARLIMHTPNWEKSPDQALLMAGELAGFLDQMQIEGVSPDGLENLVPDDYADHWRETLDFLHILKDFWPAILAEEGCMDPAERRNRLIDAATARIAAAETGPPIIAAGSTGSTPATARLLAAIAASPRGRLVLPGLDRWLEDEAWEDVRQTPAHPQYGMARLLDVMGAGRDDVHNWPGTGDGNRDRDRDGDRESDSDGQDARTRFLAEALRPAESTASWRDLAAVDVAAGCAGLEWLETPTVAEEAATIALMMRETLETPTRTAALVTPDRELARRVAAELARWDIAVDDSAGRPLARCPAGLFFRAVARTGLDRLAPVSLLTVLKHPLAGLGLPPADLRRTARQLELRLLRGIRPAPGIAGLRQALEGTARNRRKDDGDSHKGGVNPAQVIDRLARAFGPLLALMEAETAPFAAILHAHIMAAEALAASDMAGGTERLWQHDDGEALARLCAEAAAATADFPEIAPGDYPALLDSLLGGRMVRAAYGLHPRLHIWGPLEARLQQADLMILGGLNEGVWPMAPAADPWMSRPMREAFGLPPHERRIGLAAHDFAQAAAAPRVVLSRSLRVHGQPGTPSRWLERLRILLEAAGSNEFLPNHAPHMARTLAWLDLLSVPERLPPLAPPAPCPPVARRPRALSVTRIEVWQSDPYSIFARHILGLRPLEAIDADYGVAERGVFIHDALERFMAALSRNADDLFAADADPVDARRLLIRKGEEAFGAEALSRSHIRAFWWPRFLRIADWFIATHSREKDTIAASFVEISGRMDLTGPAGPFTLTAKADRIDRLTTDGLRIIDYKTGTPPTDKQVQGGSRPQLPLEAMILKQDGFPDLPGDETIAALSYWHLSGGDPAGKARNLDMNPEKAAAAAKAGLLALIAAFDSPDQPYRAVPRPEFASRFGDYNHLSRIREWAPDTGDRA